MALPASFWLASPSRFAGLGRMQARAALLALVLLLLACLSALALPDPRLAAPVAGSSGQTDLMLYEKIVAGIKAGGDYYGVAIDALRAGAYPLRPFLTVRLPALATLQAALPAWGPIVLLFALAGATGVAWGARLGEALAGVLPRIAALLLLLGSMLAFLQAGLWPFHEIWAGLLVALSLALRRPGRWVEAAAVGLLAMLIRESAAPYVAIMALLAWLEGERREALGWGAALLVFAAALAVHAHAVLGMTQATDPASPGWSGLLGFGFFVQSVTLATALQLLPLAAAALLVGLALFGWASWSDPLGLRMLVVLAAYAALIGIFARADTFYWGLIVAPVFLAGLVFAPAGIRDLVRAATLDKRRITVTRVSR
jgi:hypothetical protein